MRTKKPLEEKYVKQLISFDPEDFRKLKEIAESEERTFSWIVRQALKDYFDKLGK